MAKFCGKCGYQSDDTALVCGNCGTPLEGGAPAAAKAKLDPKFVKLGALVLGAVAVVLVICLLFCGGGHEGVVSDYFDAYANGDAELILEITPEYAFEFNKETTIKKYYKSNVQMGDEAEAMYGKDIEISYEITDTDELDEEDLEAFIDNFKEKVENWEDNNNKKAIFDPDTIEGVMDVECDVTIEGSKKAKEQDMEIRLINIDGDWFLYESRWTPGW